MASPEKMVMLTFFALLTLALISANETGDVADAYDKINTHLLEYSEKQQEAAEQEGWLARRLSSVTVSLNEAWDGAKIGGSFISLLAKGLNPFGFTSSQAASLGEAILIQSFTILKSALGIIFVLNVFLIVMNKKT